jgi:hypothetical protein
MNGSSQSRQRCRSSAVPKAPDFGSSASKCTSHQPGLLEASHNEPMKQEPPVFGRRLRGTRLQGLSDLATRPACRATVSRHDRRQASSCFHRGCRHHGRRCRICRMGFGIKRALDSPSMVFVERWPGAPLAMQASRNLESIHEPPLPCAVA